MVRLRFNPDLFRIERWFNMFGPDEFEFWGHTSSTPAEYKKRGETVNIYRFEDTWAEPISDE